MKNINDIPMLSRGTRFGGHAAEFKGETRGTLLLRLSKELGDIGKLKFFHNTAVGITSPSLLYDMFVKNARSFEKTVWLRAAVNPTGGQGLFTAEGDLWRRQRKLIAPIFRAAGITAFTGAMNEAIESYLERISDGEVVDVGHRMTVLTMEVLGKALFNIDTFDRSTELGDAVTTAFEHIGKSAGTLPFVIKMQLLDLLMHARLAGRMATLRDGAVQKLMYPLWWPTKYSKRLFAAYHILDQTMDQMIEERRTSHNKGDDLLARLIAAQDEDDGTKMSDKQIRDEAVTMFVAGHETTAVGMMWALYLLAKHPEAYRRWKNEVAALGPPRSLTAEDLPQLDFTLRVFKEALRIYPPVFVMDRTTKEEVQVGDFVLPPGIMVLAAPYAMHHRPDIYPEPERFDPDRFLPQVEASRQHNSFMPFGAGPRVCIGSQFALIEAQLALAQIAWRFDFELVDTEEPIPTFSATLRPKKPIRLRFTRIS